MKIIDGREMNKEIIRVEKQVTNDNIQIARILNPNDVLDCTVNLGINFGTPGTITIEEAKEFIKDIQDAIEAIESFKYQGCEIDYK